ncbi:hypothetical protein [Geobacter sp. SVR]|uniref:hypothetical protein n=1 Tax=Geobacter sp. SVR TaxID=2495594 RepID=UPI00143EF8CB|nr:hypothetical protein [Geobacter sp. SVR]BCS53870.1 hypothetical protein GSVR_21780 [Geobacter sp. SVR]GCF85621.1 hypothetical protein GSbR_22210 [Geobacter sp. SVR]
MYENAKQYRDIVAKEVAALKVACKCPIHDGQAGRCPRCGRKGIWDIAGIGLHLGYGNSIYYSTVFYGWRCIMCDISRDAVVH